MANALMKILKPDTIETLKSERDDLARKRRAEALRIENAMAERRTLSLAAERGDMAAQADLEKTIINLTAARNRLANLDLAIGEVNARLHVAVYEAHKLVALGALARLNAACQERLADVRKFESLLREALPILRRVYDRSEEIRKAQHKLRPSAALNGGRLTPPIELEPSAIRVRLSDFISDVGASDMINIHPARTPQDVDVTLVERERAAQKRYELSEAEVLQHANETFRPANAEEGE